MVQALEQSLSRDVYCGPHTHHDNSLQERACPIDDLRLGEQVMWHSKDFGEPAQQDDQAEGECFDPEDDFPLLEFCQLFVQTNGKRRGR